MVIDYDCSFIKLRSNDSTKIRIKLTKINVERKFLIRLQLQSFDLRYSTLPIRLVQIFVSTVCFNIHTRDAENNARFTFNATSYLKRALRIINSISSPE